MARGERERERENDRQTETQRETQRGGEGGGRVVLFLKLGAVTVSVNGVIVVWYAPGGIGHGGGAPLSWLE